MRTLSAITFRINGPRRHQCTRHNGLEVNGTEIRPKRPRVLHVSPFTPFPTERESPSKSLFSMRKLWPLNTNHIDEKWRRKKIFVEELVWEKWKTRCRHPKGMAEHWTRTYHLRRAIIMLRRTRDVTCVCSALNILAFQDIALWRVHGEKNKDTNKRFVWRHVYFWNWIFGCVATVVMASHAMIPIFLYTQIETYCAWNARRQSREIHAVPAVRMANSFSASSIRLRRIDSERMTLAHLPVSSVPFQIKCHSLIFI